MNRECWIATNQFVSAIQCLNALYCSDNDFESNEITEKQEKEMVDFAKDKVTMMQVDDAITFLNYVREAKY